MKIAKTKHDKDRAELRVSNIIQEIGKIENDLKEKVDLKKFKNDINIAFKNLNQDLIDKILQDSVNMT